ncbi:21987_t:CDS:2, partial [Gigaspora margarita]
NLAMDCFLDSLAEDTGLPEDFYGDDDPVEDLRKQFDNLTLNVAKLAKGMKLKSDSRASDACFIKFLALIISCILSSDKGVASDRRYRIIFSEF